LNDPSSSSGLFVEMCYSFVGSKSVAGGWAAVSGKGFDARPHQGLPSTSNKSLEELKGPLGYDHARKQSKAKGG